MVMEPMAEGSVGVREGVEREKFRTGLKRRGGKRKREDDDDEDGEEGDQNGVKEKQNSDTANGETKKKKIRGPKGPNPLSVKKAKKVETGEPTMEAVQEDISSVVKPNTKEERTTEMAVDIKEGPLDESQNPAVKRKRKRKHKPSKLGGLIRGIEVDRKAELGK